MGDDGGREAGPLTFVSRPGWSRLVLSLRTTQAGVFSVLAQLGFRFEDNRGGKHYPDHAEYRQSQQGNHEDRHGNLLLVIVNFYDTIGGDNCHRKV
jgi:hypothetical protein